MTVIHIFFGRHLFQIKDGVVATNLILVIDLLEVPGIGNKYHGHYSMHHLVIPVNIDSTISVPAMFLLEDLSSWAQYSVLGADPISGSSLDFHPIFHVYLLFL